MRFVVALIRRGLVLPDGGVIHIRLKFDPLVFCRVLSLQQARLVLPGGSAISLVGQAPHSPDVVRWRSMCGEATLRVLPGLVSTYVNHPDE